MKILIIGGTGLVGSYLLPRLVEKDHEVYDPEYPSYKEGLQETIKEMSEKKNYFAV